MKILDTTPISDIAQFPFKQGTLQFLQDANKEVFNSIIQAIIGATYSSSNCYVLYGCKNTGSAPIYNISSGAIFYNGEVFLVDATTFTVSTGTAVLSIATTQYINNADPVLFTDNIERNVHNIRKIVITQGTSGSTISDYANVIFINIATPPVVDIIPSGFSDNILQVVNEFPLFALYVPNPTASLKNPILTAGTVNIGSLGTLSGTESITINFGSNISPTANYYLVGTIIDLTTNGNIGTIGYVITQKFSTSCTIIISWNASVIPSINFEYICFQK